MTLSVGMNGTDTSCGQNRAVEGLTSPASAGLANVWTLDAWRNPILCLEDNLINFDVWFDWIYGFVGLLLWLRL